MDWLISWLFIILIASLLIKIVSQMDHKPRNHQHKTKTHTEHVSPFRLTGVYNVGSVRSGEPEKIPEKAANALRFVCMSDTHNQAHVHQIPDGDFFIHSGDFTNTSTPEEIQQFITFLGTLPHKYKVVIAGNHDTLFDGPYFNKNWYTHWKSDSGCPEDLKTALISSCIYLEDEPVTIQGVNFYGSPRHTLTGWAFGGEEPELSQHWAKIPLDTDILITHGPPAKYGSFTKKPKGGLEDLGSTSLLSKVGEVKPVVHLFGHVHGQYGTYPAADIETLFINAANTERNRPIVFDLEYKDLNIL